jgi:hypothetical protein
VSESVSQQSQSVSPSVLDYLSYQVIEFIAEGPAASWNQVVGSASEWNMHLEKDEEREKNKEKTRFLFEFIDTVGAKGDPSNRIEHKTKLGRPCSQSSPSLPVG